MRIFTVQRRESFAARLLKMHVYIEDYENPTTKVAGKPCRLLGYIKNGETRTFNIPESACHIYVVAGKPKGYLESELLPLPEGNQPIFVSGQNCFDFFTGTPFRFDNIVNETTYRHRSKNMKKGLGNKDLYAISAYNGGIGSVKLWFSRLIYNDTDEFVEQIPYPETKNYVKKVLRSYWVYGNIY